MDKELKVYKEILEEDIQLLGYETLRYSIFAGEDNHRDEYQVRIEKSSEGFEVYIAGERASVSGKHRYNNFCDAEEKFLNILQNRISSNRRRRKRGEEPEYPCPLWDE